MIKIEIEKWNVENGTYEVTHELLHKTYNEYKEQTIDFLYENKSKLVSIVNESKTHKATYIINLIVNGRLKYGMFQDIDFDTLIDYVSNI